ncbi:MAG: FHA domain-containing protein [Phycisphaeraceae bacterium]
MNLSLVMFKADGTRRDFPVTKDRVVIGRKPTCDLRIPLSSVSRQHCEIEVDGDRAVVRDLGSSNGTFHNRLRLQEEQELMAGDEVTVGPVIFTVVVDGEPEEIEPVRSYIDGGEGTGESERTQEQPATGGDPEPQRSAEPVDEQQSDIEVSAAGDEPAEAEGGQDSDTLSAELDDPLAALERMAEAEAEEDADLADLADATDGDDEPIELEADEESGGETSDELEIFEEEEEDQGRRK